MKTLPGAGGMSKGFLVKFSSGHVGMVQRRIGSKSSHTRTAKGYKRWTNAKGNVEKLVGSGAFSVNDILALEDMPPVPGGDERYASLGYVPLSVWAELSRAKAGTGGNNNG